MNPYDKKKYDTSIDSTDMYSQPRYPLAQAPELALQNMYEQEVTNAYMETTVSYTRRQSAEISKATGTASDIILQLLSLNYAGLAVAGGIIKSIFGLLWPTDTQQVWDTFMNAVEELIDQKIDNYARNKALAELDGLHHTLREYNDRLAIFSKEPTESHAQNLRTQVLITDNLFELSMPSFAVKDYETQLLTVYAQAANLHLAFLRDIVKFGAEWGFSQLELEDFHRGMADRTEEYTNHCVKIYNAGLEKAKKLSANLCDHSTYPWTRYNQGWRLEEKPNCTFRQLDSCDADCHEQENLYLSSKRVSIGEYQGLENWNLYNAYRRDMTIMVLDVVSGSGAKLVLDALKKAKKKRNVTGILLHSDQGSQ